MIPNRDVNLFICLSGNGAGNEATQLLRQMITCRSLGLPMPPALNMNRNMNDQPIALVKVCHIKIDTFSKNKLFDGMKIAQLTLVNQ